MRICKLVCEQGENGVVILRDRPIAIGRHPDNDIVLKDDLASRFHCVVEPEPEGAYRLRDLGSRNGTRVNDASIDAVRLAPGDVIRIGSKMFRFVVKGDAKRRPAPQRAKRTQRAHNAPASAPARDDMVDTADPEAEVGSEELDATWARELNDLIRNLPPKTRSIQSIHLIDASGRESEALGGGGLGSTAVRLILLAASKARATDIHFEPRAGEMPIRLRTDGQMITITQLPSRVGERSLGLIRNVCEMKAAARDAVLDGHFSARFPSRRVDFRASFTPSVHGQKLVLRVLDLRDAPSSINDLGLAPYMLERLRKTCTQNQGMMLTCGPTGSGKTTTLYQALRTIDREHRNVITIEDPVEYHLEGVTQIPADIDRGNTFGALLRSVLRQDPDVIFVGEIRDTETARTAMQAAMTGHLVFSTVHSKDTIGAIFRLLDLGVENHLVANSMDLVLAQRLVRVLCDNCKRPVKPTPGQSSRLGRYLQGAKQVYTATGCARCLRTGYRGRRALFELLSFNDELRDIVLHSPSITDIKRVIAQDLFTTLVESGWQLVAKGITSIDEVDRVAGG